MLAINSLTERMFAQPNAALYQDVLSTRSRINIQHLLAIQEEFITSDILANRQIILFFEEEQIKLFEAKRNKVNEEISKINKKTGLQFEHILKPIFIIYNIKKQEVNLFGTIKFYKNDFKVIRQLASILQDSSLISFNQIGTFHKNVLEKLKQQIPTLPIDEKFQKMIEKSIFFVDKTNYIDLRNKAKTDLPPLIPSINLLVTEIINLHSFQELCEKFQKKSQQKNLQNELVVKIGPDSGGRGDFFVTEKNFKIVQDILLRQDKLFKQYSQGKILRCIVQEKADLPKTAEFPVQTSVDFIIKGKNQIDIVGTAAQISSDPEKIKALGNMWSEEADKNVIAKIEKRKLLNQIKLIANQGYIGPINFDYLWDKKRNQYVDIGDLNPRESSIIFAYSMKNKLIQMGYSIHSLTQIDQTGIFHTENILITLELLNCSKMITLDGMQVIGE
ncbi:MAG TPA: hypothetical protein VLF89_06445 [Candidatus Saccharimonadales bacterium]|nr:hypothetical protein [Candidatus Saccharimonadales bacterium]